MDERSEPTDSLIDLADADIDSGGQVDASAYTLAAVFGPVAFPPGMPDYFQAAIMERADRDRDAAGDMVIDHRMNPNDPRQRQAKPDADDDDNLSQFAQIVRQEREREREEWSRTRSTVGSVTMTGAEWAQFAERLHTDEDLRRRLIEAFEAKGATHDEAEARVDRAAAAADAAAVPPNQRDEHQRALLTDPQVGADLQTANSLKLGYAAPTHPADSLKGQFEAASTTRMQEPSSMAVAPAPGMGF